MKIIRNPGVNGSIKAFYEVDPYNDFFKGIPICVMDALCLASLVEEIGLSRCIESGWWVEGIIIEMRSLKCSISKNPKTGYNLVICIIQYMANRDLKIHSCSVDALYSPDGQESLSEFLENNLEVFSRVYIEAVNIYSGSGVKEMINSLNERIKDFSAERKRAIDKKLKKSISSFFYIVLGRKIKADSVDAYSWLRARLEILKSLLGQAFEEIDTTMLIKEGRSMLPPETYKILGNIGVAKKELEGFGWSDVPALNPPSHRILSSELAGNTVDAYELIEPLLDESVLEKTLRTMDVANGCGVACDTCAVDAPLPTKIFSFDSLKRLFTGKYPKLKTACMQLVVVD